MSSIWFAMAVIATTAVVALAVLATDVYAETETVSVEGGMVIEITYPKEIVAGREDVISILVKNNGWEDKQDISFVFSLPDARSIIIDPADGIIIDRLTQSGSLGKNISLRIADDVKPGTYFLNIRYTHTLIANNETPQEPFTQDIAIPIIVKEDARVTIKATTPESIFTDAQFPIVVEVISKDIDITDVVVKLTPPDEIEFLGETLHTFSRIEKNEPTIVTAQIITPVEIDTEYKIPFEIVIQYTDDVGDEKTDSQTVPVILRPRTFMELTGDGGIWIGDFFIAPYISIGTIVGIPAGAIMTLLIKKRRYTEKRH